jgi:hypothetical protein
LSFTCIRVIIQICSIWVRITSAILSRWAFLTPSSTTISSSNLVVVISWQTGLWVLCSSRAVSSSLAQISNGSHPECCWHWCHGLIDAVVGCIAQAIWLLQSVLRAVSASVACRAVFFGCNTLAGSESADRARNWDLDAFWAVVSSRTDVWLGRLLWAEVSRWACTAVGLFLAHPVESEGLIWTIL